LKYIDRIPCVFSSKCKKKTAEYASTEKGTALDIHETSFEMLKCKHFPLEIHCIPYVLFLRCKGISQG
jgi:hypothetical protein